MIKYIEHVSLFLLILIGTFMSARLLVEFSLYGENARCFTTSCLQ